MSDSDSDDISNAFGEEARSLFVEYYRKDIVIVHEDVSSVLPKSSYASIPGWDDGPRGFHRYSDELWPCVFLAILVRMREQGYKMVAWTGNKKMEECVFLPVSAPSVHVQRVEGANSACGPTCLAFIRSKHDLVQIHDPDVSPGDSLDYADVPEELVAYKSHYMYRCFHVVTSRTTIATPGYVGCNLSIAEDNSTESDCWWHPPGVAQQTQGDESAERPQQQGSNVPPGSRDSFFLEVDDDAEIIGAVIEAAGGKRLEGRDKDFLDLAFEVICSRGRGDGIEVKEELGHDGEPIDKHGPLWHKERVPVSKLHYTQRSIKREFTDGRQFDALLADLLSGDVNLDTDKRMELEVIRKDNGKYYSTGNRRLKVFKMYQEECEHEVCVTCRVFPWHPAYDRFGERYSERRQSGLTDEDDIPVRKVARFR